MKHKIISFVLLIGLIFSLVACSTGNKTNDDKTNDDDTNAGYKIEMIDGEYYVVFEDEKYKNNVNTSQEAPYLTFASIAEMKDKLFNGRLTEEEIKTMSMFQKDSAGKVKLPNLEKLYTPTTPENIECSERVSWGGSSERYTVDLTSDDCYISLFEVQSQEWYEEKLNNTKDQLHNNKLVTITKTEQTDDRGATVYWYTTSAGELKKIEYTITTEKGTIFVTETYCLRMNHGLITVSDTIPNSIQLHGNFGDRYYYCSIYEFTERPSVEWLSSFGLVEVK